MDQSLRGSLCKTGLYFYTNRMYIYSCAAL